MSYYGKVHIRGRTFTTSSFSANTCTPSLSPLSSSSFGLNSQASASHLYSRVFIRGRLLLKIAPHGLATGFDMGLSDSSFKVTFLDRQYGCIQRGGALQGRCYHCYSIGYLQGFTRMASLPCSKHMRLALGQKMIGDVVKRIETVGGRRDNSENEAVGAFHG